MKNKYFNLIDFGSSKIRFSIYDVNLKIKFSEAKSVIIDNNFVNHFEVIKNIIRKAEKKISNHIEDIILLMDSPDLLSIEIGLKKELNKNSRISREHSSLVLELRQILKTHYSNFYIVNIILDKCEIDSKIYEELPKSGEIKNHIKIDFKVLCLPKNLTSLIISKFIENNINIKNIFCSSYVKSLSYLKNISLKKVSFLDFGMERTSLLSFKNNKLKIIKTIPIGSIHITKDISKVFNLSIEESEKIKRLFNKSESEFSYNTGPADELFSAKDIINKNISVGLLKKVILYRVQEIVDLIFEKSKAKNSNYIFADSELFLIGEGSLLFNNNSFYLDDKFRFKAINFYEETDDQICQSGLIYHLNNYEIIKSVNKKKGIFEKFFNYFSK